MYEGSASHVADNFGWYEAIQNNWEKRYLDETQPVPVTHVKDSGRWENEWMRSTVRQSQDTKGGTVMIKQNACACALGVGVLFLVTMTAAPSFALDPNLDLTTGCPQGLPPLSSGTGCYIAGTYTDAFGNNFRIDNASSSNPARIEFVEGTINKLILTGVTMVALANVTNATLTFKRPFTSSASFMNTSAVGFSARNNFSGGFNLLFPNQTARTATATAFAELCSVSVGGTGDTPSCISPGGNGTALTVPPLSGSIAANKTFGTFAPTPNQQDYLLTLGSDSKPLLRGQIVVSSLKNGEKASNLSQTILIGPTAALPPFDSTACNSDDDIGKIIRGGAGDGSQDTICVKLQDGSFQQMSGADALTLVGTPQCPVSPGEAHRP